MCLTGLLWKGGADVACEVVEGEEFKCEGKVAFIDERKGWSYTVHV